MNKVGGMNFTSLSIGILILSMFAIALGGFLVDLGTTYGIQVNESYTNTYAKIGEISNITNQINQQVIGDDATSSTTSEALFQQGQSAVIISFKAIGLIGAVLQDAGTLIGLPYWFVGGILAIILVILGFLAIAIITKQFIKP